MHLDLYDATALAIWDPTVVERLRSDLGSIGYNLLITQNDRNFELRRRVVAVLNERFAFGQTDFQHDDQGNLFVMLEKAS